MVFINKAVLFSIFILLYFPANSVFAQEDSLLKKISEIDVSLSSVDDSDEDLYMNTVSFESFYDELSPVGEWIQISPDEIKADLKDGEGQGFASNIMSDENTIYIWRPTGVENNWHPYMNGRWIFTNQGWMWASNYSWGWAVYHYGRWWNSPVFGWVWIPGHVWAPAWVRWKVTDGFIGWCPLTPYARWNMNSGITISNYNYINRNRDWIFIEKGRFAEEISSSNRVKVKENGTYISKASDLLDIKYENSKIKNYGPDVNDLQSKFGVKFNEKNITRTNTITNPVVGDKDVTVYRPDFKKVDVDFKTGKPLHSVGPGKFKIASKIKKHIIKRRIKRRLHKDIRK